MRKRIYEIIEKSTANDTVSLIYDIFMLLIIFTSLLPLFFKQQSTLLYTIDYVCTSIFIIDYILRWLTADMRMHTNLAFLKYPATPFAIIDLLAILPTFRLISQAFRVIKILRVFKVVRIFKAFRYSKNFIVIGNVVKKNAQVLISLLICSFFYILVSALLIFSIEPNSFSSFFEALYWATTALTTVGYGDIFPVTYGGRLISMFSSLFGIAMVALPAGVLTAGFLSEKNTESNDEAGE